MTTKIVSTKINAPNSLCVFGGLITIKYTVRWGIKCARGNKKKCHLILTEFIYSSFQFGYISCHSVEIHWRFSMPNLWLYILPICGCFPLIFHMFRWRSTNGIHFNLFDAHASTWNVSMEYRKEVKKRPFALAGAGPTKGP